MNRYVLGGAADVHAPIEDKASPRPTQTSFIIHQRHEHGTYVRACRFVISEDPCCAFFY